MSMIRDMDLIRAMVLAIREHEARPSASEVQTEIGDVDDGVFAYHIELLMQSAMVGGIETGPRKDRFGKANLVLTWTGQEFADNIRSDDVWERSRKTLDEAGLESASFQVWSQITVAKITELCGGT